MADGILNRRDHVVMAFKVKEKRVSVNGGPFVRFGGFIPKGRPRPDEPKPPSAPGAPQSPGEPTPPTPGGDPVCRWEEQANGEWCWVCEEAGLPTTKDCDF
jgi:hypothetical protein